MNNTPATYTITSNVADQSASVEIYDDDTPISITGADAVVEGTDKFATFTITAAYEVRPERTVNIAVSGATNFINATSIPTSITLEGLSSSTELQIPIEDDDVEEADGFIYVEILAPTLTEDGKTEYKVGATNYRAKVHVSDDDEPAQLPTISISSPTKSVEEGDNIQLSVSSSPTITGELAVNLDLSQTNSASSVNADFIIGDLTRQITLTGSSPSTSIIISTQDDEVDEPDGEITVALLPGEGYTIEAGKESATVIVADNDEPKPIVSINRVHDTIQEGEEASILG